MEDPKKTLRELEDDQVTTVNSSFVDQDALAEDIERNKNAEGVTRIDEVYGEMSADSPK